LLKRHRNREGARQDTILPIPAPQRTRHRHSLFNQCQ
jgi:hypothetical protein